MNAPNLSRRLATRIIDGLLGRGRIVVVRGGTSALVRAVDDSIAAFVSPIVDRFDHEISPAEDPALREALTHLGSLVAQTLLASEHLEDVFADRSLVEREVFETATQTFADASADERAHVMLIEVDMLGYVASTVAKFAPEEIVVEALEHAADSLVVKLSRYDVDSREALFEFGEDVCPDLRLELEEAVADELSGLVADGVVSLPAIERTRPLLHHAAVAHRGRLLRQIDRAATHTLCRTGCSARWDFPEDRSVRVVFTPLSEQDAREVDDYVAEFAIAVDSILAHAGAPLVTHVAREVDAVRIEGNGADKGDGSVGEPELPPESETEPVAVPKRAPRSGLRPKRTAAAAPKRASSKRATKRTEVKAAEKSSPRKKSTSKRTTTKKARAIKKSG